MSEPLPLWAVPAVAVIAMIYSMVGHGGASAYLAALALTPLLPREISVVALGVNLVVAGTAFLMYGLARHVSWHLCWPFLLGSAPLAFAGGVMSLTDGAFRWLLGAALLASSLRLLAPLGVGDPGPTRPPGVAVRVGVGAGIGVISGAIGIGGGVFLSPLMLLARWATAKQTAATSAVFIAANSAVGLTARLQAGAPIHGATPILVVAGVLGALSGASAGAFVLGNPLLQRVLGVVLVFGAARLMIR